MWFGRKRTKTSAAAPPIQVDHSLSEAALETAVEAHKAAQVQATQAREAVAKLHQVNIRNGFAPAIRESFNRPLGGAL